MAPDALAASLRLVAFLAAIAVVLAVTVLA